MAETKTRPTEVSAETFLAAVEPAAKREDGHVLDALFRQVTGEPGVMWGPSIVGYGRYRYTYESGHSGEMCRAGFSPRKAKHSIYLLGCRTEDPEMEGLLAKLGKHSRGVGCLYVNKLADIDLAVLEQMIALAWKRSFDSWPE
jgi:hypothetical protein